MPAGGGFSSAVVSCTEHVDLRKNILCLNHKKTFRRSKKFEESKVKALGVINPEYRCNISSELREMLISANGFF